MPQVSVEPLLPQHRDERGQQRDQKACVQETTDDNDLHGRMIFDGWNGSNFVWDCGIVEGEENGMKEGCRLVTGIRLKLFIDVYDESRANGGEQPRLQGQSLARALEERLGTHEYEGGIEVLIVLLYVVLIKLARFLFVSGVEVKYRIVELYRSEEGFKGISNTEAFIQRSVV